MAFVSSAELLVLHGVRIQGMADAGSVARRFSLYRETVEEMLLDHQARGWVRRAGFVGVAGWTLTEAGRDAGGRMLAAEWTRQVFATWWSSRTHRSAPSTPGS